MPAQLMELMRHESIDTTIKFSVGRNAESAAATLWNAVSLGNTSGNNALESHAEEQTDNPQTLLKKGF